MVVLKISTIAKIIFTYWFAVPILVAKIIFNEIQIKFDRMRMKLAKFAEDEHASWYPVAFFFILILVSGLLFYIFNDIVNDFIGLTSGTIATFFSVFWKAIIILMPIIAGMWMLIYMQRLRRSEYE